MQKGRTIGNLDADYKCGEYGSCHLTGIALSFMGARLAAKLDLVRGKSSVSLSLSLMVRLSCCFSAYGFLLESLVILKTVSPLGFFMGFWAGITVFFGIDMGEIMVNLGCSCFRMGSVRLCDIIENVAP